jgi:signal peptidase I
VLNQIIDMLAWLLLPVGLITFVDDLFLRPRRRVAALPDVPADPGWLRAAYSALPVLAVAGAIKLLRSERLDFSLVLVLVSLIGGAIWALDAWLLRGGRARAAAARGQPAAAVPEPGIVDYARSMVPVVVVVLLLRSFLFEPFRIPSDSMMPTLQDGDFILVNKFAYGLRLPVTNTRILSVGEPQRGDVFVFRFPPDPKVNYVKRVVGLPGDRVQVRDDHLVINGETVPLQSEGRFNDGCYENMNRSRERIGEREHSVLHCRSPFGLVAPPLPGCNRRLDHGYICNDGPEGAALPDAGDHTEFAELPIPAGYYLAIGDNRDNSSDSRVWGLVPEQNLVGSARRIWFNWDLQRTGGPDWSRIGRRIE